MPWRNCLGIFIALASTEIEGEVEGGTILRLQIIEADEKPNTFWREVVLSTAVPLTHQFAAPHPIQRRASETMELSIDSRIESAELVGVVMQSITAKVGFEEDDWSWIELAVHEADINAITHGNNFSPDKQIDVQLLLEQVEGRRGDSRGASWSAIVAES